MPNGAASEDAGSSKLDLLIICRWSEVGRNFYVRHAAKNSRGTKNLL